MAKGRPEIEYLVQAQTTQVIVPYHKFTHRC